MTCHRKHKMPT